MITRPPTCLLACAAVTALCAGGHLGGAAAGESGPLSAEFHRHSPAAAAALVQPEVGTHELRLIAPSWLEIRLVTAKSPDPAPVARWDFVDARQQLHAPRAAQLVVTVAGRPVPVTAVGFKRRVGFASPRQRDLRIDNALFLQLATPVAEGQPVVVTNPDGRLWAATDRFEVTAAPLRRSPAIHVNQEGYVPSFPKRAMIGYYLGSLGELPAAGLTDFRIVNAATGATALSGTLRPRPDVGYAYAPLPYQEVLQADFSGLTEPGEYCLVVPGLGASLPFVVDDGIAMNWLRTYALGLYHQRCGTTNALPFTRFVHAACHTAPAEIPTAGPAFAFTWRTIAAKNAAANPLQTAPQLRDFSTQLYPWVNQGPRDVSGGHHDAGDYSKYTIDCAALVHFLVFTADAIPGAGDLDNLGLPESGDGIGDLLQEARVEADFLAKLQDADGGFAFLVYPKNREYEQDVSLLAGHTGDPQVVWPKNTSATAAAVAALAQCASSPRFRRHFPAVAALYLRRAQLGWKFLTGALARHGKAGAYQKITFYGDEFAHDDELAWAAAELFLATGDAQYQRQLLAWFPDPGDPATFRWSWIRLTDSYGNAIRSYAFAARSGRLAPGQLDAAYLAKCEAEIAAAAGNALKWSGQNAYASSFPAETKRFRAAGWYFSVNAAADLAVAWQLDPRPDYLEALVGNLNYEGGTNPLNLSYVTGLGVRRPHVVVSQYALAGRRLLPPTGIPVGNIQAGFDYLPRYGAEPGRLTFPSDAAAAAPFPFYDRWADAWNVTAEFVTVNQARSVLALSVLVGQTAARTQPWKSGSAIITVPSAPVPLDQPVTLSVQTPGLDQANARIVWEARDQQPGLGATFTVVPVTRGPHWVEVELAWPDGRRAFGAATFPAGEP